MLIIRRVVLWGLIMNTFGFISGPALANDGHPEINMHAKWKLGMQIYSFKEYSFYEALDKTAALGLTWVEAYPGQKLSADFPGVNFNHDLSSEHKEKIRKTLRAKGLRLINYGVVSLPDDEAACRKVFDFAREMGIQTIVSEPPDEAWDLIDKLCREYKINVAIHNHPEPSHYWNPEKILEVSEGRSTYIGACADIGHWMRSGIDPVEALRLLQGRIISLHFGDLNVFGDKDAHDVPWGSGVADLNGVFNELQKQDFSGVFSIEYEYNWKASVPEIRQSISYFNMAAGQIQPSGWKNLLAGGLSGWIFNADSWTLTNGILAAKEGGDIWSRQVYSNFVLDLEFKLDKGTNSGVFLRTGSIESWLHTAIEVQIFDSYKKEKPDKHDCGAIFDCLEPAANAVLPPGKWNRYSIICKDNKISVVLNGQDIIDMDLDLWKEAHKNPDGSTNKFNTAYRDMPRKGHIGLQYHGNPVWFRNIRLKEI